MGSKTDDTHTIQLSKAFADKELEVIVGDLGITKEDTDKYFKLLITKVGLVEKAAIDETLFLATYPNEAIKTEEEFRAALKKISQVTTNNKHAIKYMIKYITA